MFSAGAFSADEADSALAARAKLGRRSHHLCLIDVGHADGEALELCRHIREEIDLGVILLSSQAEPEDRILGLEMGADDYVAKPFNPRELIARVHNVIERRQLAPPGATREGRLYRVGDWRFDVDAREISRFGNPDPIALSTIEHKLLCVLVENAGALLSRDALGALLGAEQVANERIVDAHINRLRKKIGDTPNYVKTVRGAGYMLCARVERL